MRETHHHFKRSLCFTLWLREESPGRDTGSHNVKPDAARETTSVSYLSQMWAGFLCLFRRHLLWRESRKCSVQAGQSGRTGAKIIRHWAEMSPGWREAIQGDVDSLLPHCHASHEHRVETK